MYGNQPLSKSGCQNQANHWCCGYYLSNQVLINYLVILLALLFTLLLPTLVIAEEEDSEPRYYTWVDAQGVMHNTLITPNKNTEKRDAPAKADSDSDSKSDFNTDDFPTEETHQKNLEKQLEDQQPFFTWIDAQGIVRSEPRPKVVVDFVAEEVVYDAVFAPPFRLPDYVQQGECCARYAAAFTSVAALNGSASYHIDDTSLPFKTQLGDVAAGYFSLPKLAAKEMVAVKGYKLPSDSEFEVIALDAQFQPLYLASQLQGLYVEQTWKDLAYKKIMLEISDSEIKYLVVFVRPALSTQDNLPSSSALNNYRLSVMREQILD